MGGGVKPPARVRRHIHPEFIAAVRGNDIGHAAAIEGEDVGVIDCHWIGGATDGERGIVHRPEAQVVIAAGP